MNTKLATSRMRTGQWADIIKECKESGLKVDDYWALIILAFKYHCILCLEAPNPGAETFGVNIIPMFRAIFYNGFTEIDRTHLKEIKTWITKQ